MPARRALRVTLLGLAALGLSGGASAAEAAAAARLTLSTVFGQTATGLSVPFGAIDSECIATPVSGVTCVSVSGGATWYGGIAFAVRITGAGPTRLRLVGARQPGGTVPSAGLLDGAAGAVPTRVYPVQPAAPIALATAIGNGNTTVSRAIGLTVRLVDAGGPWSTSIVYSLVVE